MHTGRESVGAHSRSVQLCTGEGIDFEKLYTDEVGGTETANFVAQQGPAHLPSVHVDQMRDNGWTCLPALVHPEDLAELRELRDADMVTPQQRRKRMTDSKNGGGMKQPFLRSSVLARLAVDPTVMYVLRQVRCCCICIIFKQRSHKDIAYIAHNALYRYRWSLQYLRSNAVQAGHIPSILTALPVDHEEYPGPQGWHSDFP